MQSRMRTALIAGGLVAAVAVIPSTTAAAAGGVTVSKVSVRPDGKSPTYGALNGAISEDGKHVAFVAPSQILESTGKLYVHHLTTGRVESVCTSASGRAANRRCDNPVLSPHGRYVAFSTTASNLVPGDTNNKLDAFIKDLRTGKIRRVSTTPTGKQIATGSYLTGMSADATKVVFTSAGVVDPAHPPVPDKYSPGKFYAQVYVKDLTSGAVTAVSATADGTFGNDLSGESGQALISPDGGTVAFQSRADNLGLEHPYTSVYLKNLKTGALTSLESLLKLKLPKYNYIFDFSAPSRGGTRIAFAIGIDRGEENEDTYTNNTGVLVADLGPGKVIHVVKTRSGKRAHWAQSPVLSADGRRVAFAYPDGNLLAGDKDKGGGSFVQTISSGAIRHLSVPTRSAGDVQHTVPTSISGDGTDVAIDAEGKYHATRKTIHPAVFVARF